MNLQTGAFGDPSNTETLVLFWTKMELLHYPGAAETKQYLEQKLELERKAQQMQMQVQTAAQMAAQPAALQKSAAATPQASPVPNVGT